MPATPAPQDTPPHPDDVVTPDDLAEALRALRAWAGVGYRELHRRVGRVRRSRPGAVVPAYDTVYRCLQPGRHRIDAELVADIVLALGTSDLPWRAACRRMAAPDAAATGRVARGLPALERPLVGRTEERARLVALLAAAEPVDVLVAGMAGVGKTALATRAAHDVAARGHRDLVLVAELAGFAPGRQPADPAAVLGGLLAQLDVPGPRVSQSGLERRRRLLVEALGGRRALVVLDDAADEQQLRPLLALGPGVSTLVTSRRRLRPSDSVVVVDLDVLDGPDAVALLTGFLDGRGDPPGDEGAIVEMADLLDRHPLALVLAGRRAAANPRWSVRDHVEHLAELRSHHRLDDGVTASLDSSYAELAPAARRAFRMLSLHPGPTLDIHEVAALADLSIAGATDVVGLLVQRHLLHGVRTGEWARHDLVTVFATNRALAEDPPRERASALARLHALHAAATAAAMAHYAPQESPQRAPGPDPTTPVPRPTGRDEAFAWLRAAAPRLVAVARDALARDLDDHADLMSSLLFRFLLQDFVESGPDLFGLLVEHSDGAARARNLNSLGALHGSRGRYTEAYAAFVEARDLTGDDLVGLQRVTANLGAVAYYLGDFEAAAAHSLEALRLAEEAQDDESVSHNLTNAGIALQRLGRHDEAARCHQRALGLVRTSGDDVDEGRVVGSLGRARLEHGRHRLAQLHLRRSLSLAVRTGDRITEAEARTGLATLASCAGRHSEALAGHRRALALLDELGGPDHDIDIVNDLAESQLRAGRADEAAASYRRALELALEATAAPAIVRARAGLELAEASRRPVGGAG